MENGLYLKLPCLAKSGAPVQPKVILGGFNGDKYSTAKSLIITFVVNNHKNENENKKAEAWEKAFIDYMKYWEKEEAPALNLSVAYSSERSIQDEISRASESDVATILISYLLMFLYIAIGLGQFKSCARILVRLKCFYVFVCIVVGFASMRVFLLIMNFIVLIFRLMQKSQLVLLVL